MKTNFNKHSSTLSYECIVCKNTFNVYIQINQPYQTSLCDRCIDNLKNIDRHDIDKAVRVGSELDGITHELIEITRWYKKMKNM